MGDPATFAVPGARHLSGSEFRELYDIVLTSKADGLHDASANVKNDEGFAQRSKNGAVINDSLAVTTSANFDPNENRCRKWFHSCCSCFCCCRNRLAVGATRTDSAIEAILAWDTKHCKTPDDFLSLLTVVTNTAEESVQGLRPLLVKLSFLEESESAEAQKLSIVGGYLWIITYGMQFITMSQGQRRDGSAHLLPAGLSNTDIDPYEIQYHPNPRLSTRLMETHSAYEEIGELVQELRNLTFQFLRLVEDLRQNGAQLVSIVQNKFQFKQNPFQEIPKVKPSEVRKTKTLDIKQTVQRLPDLTAVKPLAVEPTTVKQTKPAGRVSRSLRSHSSPAPLDTADNAKLHQSPVVILVQATPGGRWEVFSTLEAPEKVELIAMFIQEPLRLLSGCIKSFKRSITPSESIEQPGTARPSSILELTCGLVHVAGSSKFVNFKFITADLAILRDIIKKFWNSVDSLYETTVKLVNITAETCDIVRSCYVYSDNFYSWELKSFDLNSKKGIYEPEERIRKFASEVIGNADAVDVAKFYSLADFMTSQYQVILQRNPVSSHGISLVLESWDDTMNEPWGLADNIVDRRKSKAASKKNKSQNFTLSYRSSHVL